MQAKSKVGFLELESSMRAAALKVAGKLLEAKLNDDTSDYHGQACQCSCGGTAVYRGRRAKTFVTVVGEITLERPTTIVMSVVVGSILGIEHLGSARGFYHQG